MALIFLGHTKCGLCEKILHSGEAIEGLPPSANKDHYLYEHFDKAFHQTCFDNWEEREEILKVIAEEKIQFENSDYYKEMQMKFGKPGSKS